MSVLNALSYFFIAVGLLDVIETKTRYHHRMILNKAFLKTFFTINTQREITADDDDDDHDHEHYSRAETSSMRAGMANRGPWL